MQPAIPPSLSQLHNPSTATLSLYQLTIIFGSGQNDGLSFLVVVKIYAVTFTLAVLGLTCSYLRLKVSFLTIFFLLNEMQFKVNKNVKFLTLHNP